MKALVADAEWKPRKNYTPSHDENRRRRAAAGSQVWQNPRLDVKTVPVPPVRDDEVLVRVAACGICGSDIHTYESDPDGYIIFSGPARFPSVLGHEFSGEVVEVGRNVVGFEKGDIVTSESIMWCGACLPCRSGMLNQCENVELMGLTADGAFAEFISVKASYCWKLNGLGRRFEKKDVFRIGTLIEPIGCAYNGIFISGHGFLPGSFAIVYGAGPIGLGAVKLLRIAGAAKVFVIDVIQDRLEIAKMLGADHVFDLNQEQSVVESIREMTGGWGADVQVEAAGAALTIPLIQKLCAPRGKVIYLGRAEDSATLELNKMVSGAISLAGSRGHSGYGIYAHIIRLVESGRMDGVEKIITSVFPFSEMMQAFAASRKRTDGKILIEMG